jgi:DNA end-binding protein Ku
VPDGEVGQQAFAVILEAIRKEGMVALARVVFTSREHVIALEPRGKGLLGVTLRYPYEVRKEDEYFADIEDEKIPKDMMELASHIVETKSGHFKPEEFEDHYEDALKELLKKKQTGEKIEAPRAREPAKVISLMDALRRSVDAERGGGGRGQSGTASSTTSHAEESRPVICGAEEGRLILAPGEPSKILGRCCAGEIVRMDVFQMQQNIKNLPEQKMNDMTFVFSEGD